ESIKELIGKKFFAKLRYRHEGTLCEVVSVNESFILNCHLLSPVRAITKGQSAVFYDEEGQVMLGGIIV
ncbi:MAG: tRNA 2-thiouridine(34) synthase MnmA, partial [Lachnospiraceae bacterium]|nr:tRNA 2-thiouridine(34) synthase MnmA [Lachnospiraceae bacterium]